MNLIDIDDHTRDKVLRLLDRVGYQLTTPIDEDNHQLWLYIDPLSRPILAWNIFFLLVFYMLQLQLQLSITFGPRFFEDEVQLGNGYRFIYLTMLACLLLDIFLSFFKGYNAFGKGKTITNGAMIVRNYLSSQFPFDLTVTLVYVIPLVYQSEALNILQLVPLLLLWKRKFLCEDELQIRLQYRSGIRSMFAMVLLFADALILGSYGACIFIVMDKVLYN